MLQTEEICFALQHLLGPTPLAQPSYFELLCTQSLHPPVSKAPAPPFLSEHMERVLLSGIGAVHLHGPQ